MKRKKSKHFIWSSLIGILLILSLLSFLYDRTKQQARIHAKEKELVDTCNALSMQLSDFVEKTQNGLNKEHPTLVVSKSGDIVSSLENKEIGLNIFNDTLENAELGSSLQRCFLTRTTDLSKFTIDTKTREEHFYISFPVENSGVAAFRIDFKPIYDLLVSSGSLFRDDRVLLLQERVNDTAMISVTSGHQDFQLLPAYHPFANDPIDRAMSGQNGGGQGKVLGKQVVAGWSFIPKLNWSVVALADLDLLLAPISYLSKLAWYFFIAALVLLVVLVFVRVFKPMKKALFSHKVAPNVLVILIVLSAIVVAYQSYLLFFSRHEAIRIVQNDVKEKIALSIKNMSVTTRDIVFVTKWLAKDLDSGRLKKQDLTTRLKRDFQETESIEKILIAFDPPPLDGLQAIRKGNGIEISSSLPFDYTKEAWYNVPKSGESHWLPVFQDHAMYVAPFAKGVIAGYLDFSQLEEKSNFFAGMFLISEEGKLIGTPSNETWAAASYFRSNKKTGEFLEFQDHKNSTYFLLVEQIPYTPWFAAALIKESDITIEASLLRKYIFGCIVALLLLSITTLGRFVYCNVQRKKLFWFSSSYTILMATGVIALWIVVRSTSSVPSIKGLMVQDENSLENFMNLMKQEASTQSLAPPIFIPTGIWISYLELLEGDKLMFSGLAWQKYPLDGSLKRELIFPQASEFFMEKIFSKEIDHQLLLNWNIRGVLEQKRNKSAFPFDSFLVKIYLETPNGDDRVFLVPDLESYYRYVPSERPGIAPQISIPGYNVMQTFFSLEKDLFLTNLGRSKSSKVKEQYTLCYNIYLVRHFLIPFLPFIIPLIAIQVGMYAVFLMTKKEKGLNFVSSISVYTGGFFAFAILQLSLRTRYAGESILYAETFFFFGYLIISLLYAHAIATKLASKESYLVKVKPALNYLFWPFELTVWFLITLWYFYG